MQLKWGQIFAGALEDTIVGLVVVLGFGLITK